MTLILTLTRTRALTRTLSLTRTRPRTPSRNPYQVRIFSDQFAFRARRTQGDRTQIEWIFGPRSVAILPSELINKPRMCEIAGKRLEDLRVREEVRTAPWLAQPGGRPSGGASWRRGGGLTRGWLGGLLCATAQRCPTLSLSPRASTGLSIAPPAEQVRGVLVPASTQHTEVEQLLGERRGLFSLQLTTDRATALWQARAAHTPHCTPHTTAHPTLHSHSHTALGTPPRAGGSSQHRETGRTRGVGVWPQVISMLDSRRSWRRTCRSVWRRGSASSLIPSRTSA